MIWIACTGIVCYAAMTVAEWYFNAKYKEDRDV